MLLSWTHWPILRYVGGLPIKAWKLCRPSSKRRKGFAPFTELKSRNGGRSSRQRTSRASDAKQEGAMALRRRQFLNLAAAAVALPAVPRMARAQVYPTRPVRIIVGYVAGGGTDIVARLIGQWLSERLGRPFI